MTLYRKNLWALTNSAGETALYILSLNGAYAGLATHYNSQLI